MAAPETGGVRPIFEPLTLSDSLGLKAVADRNEEKREEDPGDLLLPKADGKAITIFHSAERLPWVFEAGSKQIRGIHWRGIHWTNRSPSKVRSTTVLKIESVKPIVQKWSENKRFPLFI
jgi:hypothetical protein